MEHVGTLFSYNTPTLVRIPKKDRETERGSLMTYFLQRLNPSRVAAGYKPLKYARMGVILEGIPTKDLYYIKRVCDDAPHWGKKFWWLLDPKKHPEDGPKDVRAIS